MNFNYRLDFYYLVSIVASDYVSVHVEQDHLFAQV